MLSIQNPSHQTNIPTKPMLIVKDKLGQDASLFISEDRIDFMLMMTKGNIHDTVLMALGYIIQHLDLLSRSDKKLSAKYCGEMEHYRHLLHTYLKK